MQSKIDDNEAVFILDKMGKRIREKEMASKIKHYVPMCETSSESSFELPEQRSLS